MLTLLIIFLLIPLIPLILYVTGIAGVVCGALIIAVIIIQNLYNSILPYANIIPVISGIILYTFIFLYIRAELKNKK